MPSSPLDSGRKDLPHRDIKIKCANRQTPRRSIRHSQCVMQDLLQYIDVDYYRSARLLIARAEIAQFRRQASALARTNPPLKLPAAVSRPVDDLDQTSPGIALL